MGVTTWLRRRVPDFDQLSADERKAIKDFTLLWSLFEGEVLGTRASADRIIKAVRELTARKAPSLHRFDAAILRFRRRYYDGRGFTPAFDDLRFGKSDHRPLVESFVANRTADEAEILSGLLIIVYRLRNNLFHGIKWTYGIRGQFNNFRHANGALMEMMELYP